MKLRTILALALAFNGVAKGQTGTPAAVAPDTLITLQRGGCESHCAVYRLVIFADGTVIYEGRHFVRRSGLIQSGISPAVLSKLIADLESGGFFGFESNYGYGSSDHCDSIDPDRPMAILSVSHGARSKTILHHHRCVGAAQSRLTELEDKVDQAAETSKWIK